MANELTMSGGMTLVNGTTFTQMNTRKAVTITNKKAIVKPVTVTTTAAAIDFTGLTTPKAIELVNTDPTNYVEVGPDSAGTMIPLIRMLPGEPSGSIPLVPGVTIKWKANTASCVCDMMAVDT